MICISFLFMLTLKCIAKKKNANKNLWRISLKATKEAFCPQRQDVSAIYIFV